MPAGSTYTPIATTTFSSGSSSYTFSSIPSTYTDLILVGNLAASTSTNIYFRLNGDTGTNYSYTLLSGDGSTAASARTSTTTRGTATWTGASLANTRCTLLVSFMNYANTTTYKTFLTRYSSLNAVPQGEATVGANLWRSTSAINSITITSLSPNYDTGSTLTLYGIASA